MNQNYELVVILDPEIIGAEQEKLLDKIKKLIGDKAGTIESFKELGKKEMAYSIAKKSTGFYFYFKFTSSTDQIASVKQKLQLDEKVLRYLLSVAGGEQMPRKIKKKEKEV